MPDVSTFTRTAPFRRVWATNRTESSLSTPADATALPTLQNSGRSDTTNGYLDLGADRVGGTTADYAKLMFYGAGAENETGQCRVYGLAPLTDSSGAVLSYTHVLLGDYSFILSTAVGVASGRVLNSERYADTITRTSATIGIEDVTDRIYSPTGNLKGFVLLDVSGYRYLFVEPVIGTADSVNVLIADM
jgi:hypothetical protein